MKELMLDLTTSIIQLGPEISSVLPQAPFSGIMWVEALVLAWIVIWVWLTSIPVKVALLKGRRASDQERHDAISSLWYGVILILMGIFGCHFLTSNSWSKGAYANLAFSLVCYVYRYWQIRGYLKNPTDYHKSHGPFRDHDNPVTRRRIRG